MSGCYLDRGGGKHETLHETQGVLRAGRFYIGKRTNKGHCLSLGIYSGLCESFSVQSWGLIWGACNLWCSTLRSQFWRLHLRRDRAQFIRHRWPIHHPGLSVFWPFHLYLILQPSQPPSSMVTALAPLSSVKKRKFLCEPHSQTYHSNHHFLVI